MEGSPPLLASLVLTSAGVKRKVRHLLRENCGAEGLLRGLIDGTPVDHRAEDARFGEQREGNLGEIVRKDDEIRVLAGFQLTFLPFLKLRVGDRKSTRLNSSHQIISYAVFCLKKKRRPGHTARRLLHSPATRSSCPRRRPCSPSVSRRARSPDIAPLFSSLR